MKVALYGGTFDPIHYGHLVMAEEIRQRLLIDQVYFIPCAEPPHKDAQRITPAKDRWMTVTLATLSNPHFLVSNVEIDRGGPSYSIDTIRFFKQSLGPKTRLYFIMGLDSFLDISTWKALDELLYSCQFIITSRAGLDLQAAINNLMGILSDRWQKNHQKNQEKQDNLENQQNQQKQENQQKQNISYTFSRLEPLSEMVYKEKVDWKETFIFVEAPQIDISSTMIRDRTKAGKSLRYLVPPAVEEYIRKQKLYCK